MKNLEEIRKNLLGAREIYREEGSDGGVQACSYALDLLADEDVRVLPVMQVWRFDDAPEELRRLSRHGGDEDWVVMVPAGYEPVTAMNLVERLTVSDSEVHIQPDGSAVYITAHA